MVAVGPDLREFCVSAVEQMAIDNKLLANSDELSQAGRTSTSNSLQACGIALWHRNDPDMWARALKYAERAAAVAALH